MSSQALDSAKIAFIEAAIEHGVLLFGNFTLKSGRQSPYFFNAGLLYSSSLLSTTAQAYAKVLSSSRIPDFDVLFGPAYKGISLAAVSAVSLYQQTGKDIGYCYNRKEKKDHGEGGTMVGAPLKGRIVIIDDVLTSGKAIREAIDILKASPEAKLVGIVQLVDRQEKGQSGSGKSTVQEVEEEFGVPVEPIIGLDDIVKYLESSGKWEKELQEVRKYRAEYGVQRS
ncbi:orotate phosphoribosyltransferase [Cryptococcus neoformans C23]|uniref:Orotate phosphoribosyltransferase n=2 Tax=Cryptococcus neoformans TaxID=5207 RepID=PYRE_CRYN9|nr:orotate phosphoribosyltransferase [Cryptococcus neoformans var. grubii H99]J9VQB3.1 RecName: Full=Orotate phosphoribosyltransferase; Short=OPRT; Short=OPRTase [Cryptococcus neoformans var. grubii H99]AAA99183.1 URA5 [Cryptococcus neoformans]AAB86887.1 orotate phosphoribosyltransferase [Cryptococcus neoformans var. grubii]OWZ30308.1 orotate phosphoribosyltransferase [Cryptococcus neoformans var. grubii AD2-60a]OWZ38271.1 orotate phosphoribosyltransferase [Cryptococcus neoformans var. grubii |eukprot:XP_012051090.1 orotate phosphoribosyltransferase [Cryptococcus neoformans var. grubii H99]